MQAVRELRDEKLDFWIQHNQNVLFVGHYGSGKTTRILDAFKRNKLKFKYFSAATMDPWCDFIGVPKVITDERGPYLDYVLPRDLRDDTVEAIYMDEFNRSHKKVRNAVMELLQFKSINGRPFNKLRLIWAAINPEDEGEYQVEALDKAQKDRFQVQIAIPYEPSLEYFLGKFDMKQAKAAISWWKTLTPELQMEVSPRRLEYALQMFNLPGGNIKDVLPYDTNPSALSGLLKVGPIDERMKDVFKTNDLDAAKKLFKQENNYSAGMRHICDEIPGDTSSSEWMLFFLQSISTEKLTSLLATNEIAYKFILSNCDKAPLFRRMINDVLKTNTDKILVRRIEKEMKANRQFASLFGDGNGNHEKPYFSKHKKQIPLQWKVSLSSWLSQPMDTTPQRMKIYDELVDWIPETMTADEAVDTLEMISLLSSRSHVDTLKNFRYFLGVINQCIDQIHKANGLSWTEILTNYGQRFAKLLDKLRDAGLDKKLLCPVKRVP